MSSRRRQKDHPAEEPEEAKAKSADIRESGKIKL
jgi:hypothetical protein